MLITIFFNFAGLIFTQLDKVSPQSVVSQSATSIQEPPLKKGLFGHYKRQVTSVVTSTHQQLTGYLNKINDSTFNPDLESFQRLYSMPEYSSLRPLFDCVFCVPATSAPVERVFSHSGFIMRPHRARMSDGLLETLIFLKCNKDI